MATIVTLRRALVITTAVCAFLWLGHRDASAGTSLYMECPGLQGSSVSDRHRGWVDLTTFELGAAGTTRATITKGPDAASSRLSHVGTTFATCTVELDRTGVDTRAPYRTYKLAGVAVRRYDVTVGTAHTTETIGLTFSRLDTIDVTCDAAGRCGTPTPVPTAGPAVPATATPAPAPRVTPTPVFHPRLPGPPVIATPPPPHEAG